MINVQLSCKKSHFEHRSGSISNLGENVACPQPSVSQEEAEIQNSHFEHELSKRPSEDPEEYDRKPAAERIKKPEDEAQSWAQEEQIEEPTPKPWEDKKDYQTIFRKYISIGEDSEEHYDVIDMQIEAQRAVTGFYPSPISFWSCTHMNSCQNYTLHINLHILLIILLNTSLKFKNY